MYSDSQDAAPPANVEVVSSSVEGGRRAHSSRRHHRGTASAEEEDHCRQTRAKDAPHCITCCCLTNGKMKCSYRQLSCYERCLEQQNLGTSSLSYSAGDYQQQQQCDSPIKQPSSATGRRQSGRRKIRATTVDELLREMKLNMSPLSDDEGTADVPRAPSKNEDEETTTVTGRRRHHWRRSGSYYSATRRQPKLGAETSARRSAAALVDVETRVRSCERWSITDRKRDEDKGSVRMVEPTVEDLGTDNTADNAVANELSKNHRSGDSYCAWRQPSVGDERHPVALLEAGDFSIPISLTHREKEAQVESDVDRRSLSLAKEDPGSSRNEAHVRELKLVRREFIERITEEVQRLHRLQRHLDGCSPRRSGIAHTRSVSTMTSGRRPASGS